MAKFCKKCGSRLDEATGLCPQCNPEVIQPPMDDCVEEPQAPPSKKEVRQQKKAQKKAAKKQRKLQRKADKKAKKKAKWASLTVGQKVRKVTLKFLLWVLLLSLLGGGVLCSLVYFNVVEIPVISNVLGYFGIVSQKDGATDPFQNLGEGFTDRLVVDGDSAIAAAQDAAKSLGLDGLADELTVASIHTVDGMTYYRLQQNYNGIPVTGKTMVVIADRGGNAVGFTTNAVSPETVAFGTPPDMTTVRSNVTRYLNDCGYNLNEHNVAVENCYEEKRAFYDTGSEIIPVYVLQVFLNDAPLSFMTATIHAQSGDVLVVEQSVYEGDAIVYNANRTLSVNGYYEEASGE